MYLTPIAAPLLRITDIYIIRTVYLISKIMNVLI